MPDSNSHASFVGCAVGDSEHGTGIPASLPSGLRGVVSNTNPNRKLKAYCSIVKPGIVLGNLVTAAAGFFLASRGRVDGEVLAAVLGGIALTIASGGVFNNCIDRNIDRRMLRTRHRALARGLVPLKSALSYAALLGLAGLALLWAAAGLPAAGIVLAGLVIYVCVYSLYLKRRSACSALAGSLAGAAPPLAGYCAAAGSFDLGAVILLAVFSLWQLPHCYAIAVFRFDDYRAAAIPILPVRKGTAAARYHMIGYILAFWAASLMLTFAGYTGYRTLAVATALCLSWLYITWSGCGKKDERIWARRLFLFSLLTIFLLSVMMAVDYR